MFAASVRGILPLGPVYDRGRWQLPLDHERLRVALRNGHEAGRPERSLLADGAEVGSHACVPSPEKTEARLSGLLLLICYALRSGSVFLASEWRPSS
jgi:hypothetical protein